MTSTPTSRLEGLTTSLAVKAPVRLATTANITLSGLQTIDGITAVADDRVLVRSQTDAVENGIYNAASGAWERAKDFNGSLDGTDGTLIYVRAGTVGGGNFFRLTATDPVIIATDELSFVNMGALLSGSGSSSSSLDTGAAAGFMEPFIVLDNSNTTASDTTTGESAATAATRWQTLDLSAYVPKGCVAVYLEFALYMATANVNTHWQFRAAGDLADGIDSDGSRRWYPSQTATIYYGVREWVRLSADGAIQYKRANSGGTTNYWKITLWGYQ